ncbi:aldolase [Sphingomonas sp. AP4-R1]|uniref:HPr kinase/phosphorylase n=1 Tax=Sphingomonas sp. AP4-R1 TaxID=2735134 RepID=UPI001493C86E|nr:HPr kinase/phosphatase C-terminal domain-containing protein [Sphingomonas sp. AP4-R1]QJU59703.1 aldolase [Sphingomonas sp. AP4-R1]
MSLAPPPSETLHATCVAIDGRGVLILGPSGAGKSDLALRLIDRGAVLVSDDGVEIRIEGDRPLARAPHTIAGQMEVRGLGIVAMPALAEAPVALCISLTAPRDRMPPDPLPTTPVAARAIPTLALDPFEASAPIKVERGLALYGLPA